MAKRYKITYQLIYEGGSKLTQGTSLIMETSSTSEAVRKIRETNNFTTPNIKDIQIIKIEED